MNRGKNGDNGMVLEVMGSDKTLSLPGVRFTKTALVFEREPSEEMVREVGHLLQRMESSLSYWQGDHVRAMLPHAVAYEDAAGLPSGDRQQKERQLELEKIAEYAEISGQNREALSEAASVAQFFPAAARRETLKFEHHVEAFNGSGGDFLVANAWLDLAEASAWDVAKLRAHIRAQRAQRQPTGPRPDDVDDEAAEVELWASREINEVSRMSPAAARQRLIFLSNTAKLIDALKARAAESPVKESLGRC